MAQLNRGPLNQDIQEDAEKLGKKIREREQYQVVSVFHFVTLRHYHCKRMVSYWLSNPVKLHWDTDWNCQVTYTLPEQWLSTAIMSCKMLHILTVLQRQTHMNFSLQRWSKTLALTITCASGTFNALLSRGAAHHVCPNIIVWNVLSYITFILHYLRNTSTLFSQMPNLCDESQCWSPFHLVNQK